MFAWEEGRRDKSILPFSKSNILSCCQDFHPLPPNHLRSYRVCSTQVVIMRSDDGAGERPNKSVHTHAYGWWFGRTGSLGATVQAKFLAASVPIYCILISQSVTTRPIWWAQAPFFFYFDLL